MRSVTHVVCDSALVTARVITNTTCVHNVVGVMVFLEKEIAAASMNDNHKVKEGFNAFAVCFCIFVHM